MSFNQENNPYAPPRNTDKPVIFPVVEPPSTVLTGKYLKYAAPVIRHEYKDVTFDPRKKLINVSVKNLRSGVPLKIFGKAYGSDAEIRNSQFQVKTLDVDKIPDGEVSIASAIDHLKGKIANVGTYLRQYEEVNLAEYHGRYLDKLKQTMSKVAKEVKLIRKDLYRKNIEKNLNKLLFISEHVSNLDNILADDSRNPLYLYSSSTIPKDGSFSKICEPINSMVHEYNHDRSNALKAQYALADHIAWEGLMKQQRDQSQGCLMAAATLPWTACKTTCGAMVQISRLWKTSLAASSIKRATHPTDIRVQDAHTDDSENNKFITDKISLIECMSELGLVPRCAQTEDGRTAFYFKFPENQAPDKIAAAAQKFVKFMREYYRISITCNTQQNSERSPGHLALNVEPEHLGRFSYILNPPVKDAMFPLPHGNIMSEFDQKSRDNTREM